MKLPIRASSHIAENWSKKTLLGLLPDEWIARDVFPDYGIDLSIEIWNRGRPLGRTVNVQLRTVATFDKRTKGILRVPIKKSTLNYLNQHNPSFLVCLYYENPDIISIARVKEILQIYLPVIQVKGSAQTVTIPMVYCRESYDSDRYYSWCNATKWRIVFTLGTSDGVPGWAKRRGKYYTFFENEDEFWRREAFANLGYYISVFRPQLRKRAISFLIEAFSKEEGLGIIGILEAFYYLNYSSNDLCEIAKKWLYSDNAQKALVGAHYLGITNDVSHLNSWDTTIQNMAESLSKEDEMAALVRVFNRKLGRIYL